jgi:hypothetical protein
MMATDKDRLTVTHGDEMRERVERVKDAEGLDHDAEVGRELLRRGLDDWEHENNTYPGSEFVEQAIRVSAAGFVVGVAVSVMTASGLAVEQTIMLGAVVTLFVGIHYTALLVEAEPSAEPDDVRDTQTGAD